MKAIILDWHDAGAILEKLQELFDTNKVDHIIEELYDKPNNVVILELDTEICKIKLCKGEGSDNGDE